MGGTGDNMGVNANNMGGTADRMRQGSLKSHDPTIGRWEPWDLLEIGCHVGYYDDLSQWVGSGNIVGGGPIIHHQ